MIIKKVKPQHKDTFFTILFTAAQFAFLTGVILGRLETEIPAVDFITGMLMGFSIVGNLAYLIRFGQKRRIGQQNANQKGE